jgi:DNA invertase Pin-like site-specific DNA recombinase
MIYGYARISTDGQSVTAQVAALRKHGAGKVFREVASGAKTDRPQLRRLLSEIGAGDVVITPAVDRLGAHRARPGRRQSQRRQIRPQADPHPAPAEGSLQAPRCWRDAASRAATMLEC